MFNKPIYVGFAVLELSKWLMYDFHCNFIKKHFDTELLFTDIGSLTYEIKSKHKHFTLAIFQKTQSFIIVNIK